MNIYVGNLSYDVSEDDVRDLFEKFGNVESIKLITDRDTGRPKGFGFIDMSDEDGNKAIKELNGQTFATRELVVNEAREREPRSYQKNRF